MLMTCHYYNRKCGTDRYLSRNTRTEIHARSQEMEGSPIISVLR